MIIVYGMCNSSRPGASRLERLSVAKDSKCFHPNYCSPYCFPLCITERVGYGNSLRSRHSAGFGNSHLGCQYLPKIEAPQIRPSLIAFSSCKKMVAVAVSPRPTVMRGSLARREGISETTRPFLCSVAPLPPFAAIAPF